MTRIPSNPLGLDERRLRDYIGEMTPLWTNPMWCPRHWAAGPLLGRDCLAAIDLMGREARRIRGGMPTDQWVIALRGGGPICCRIGDQAVADLWLACPARLDRARLTRLGA